MKRWLLSIVMLLWLTACSGPTPSLGFAPEGTIITRAITVALEQTQASLAQQLTTSLPDTEISNIKVTAIEPLYIGKLPTYHLKGTYVLKLNLADNKTEKQTNEFDIYLQRQIEGKTWRLLRKQPDREEWFSYSLEKY